MMCLSAIRKKRTRWLLVLSFLLITSCRPGVPIEPTVIVPPTQTPTFEPTIDSTQNPPTLPPTWTPTPTKTPIPVTVVVPPGPAEQTLQAPIGIVSGGNNTIIVTLTEAQLNSAIIDRYDAAPLSTYKDAPHVTLDDGGLVITMHIVPQNAPADSQPQTMTLVGTFNIFNGALELQPSELSPANVGVTTKQVKLAHALLMRTISELVLGAAGGPGFSYNYAIITPDQLSLTVATAAK